MREWSLPKAALLGVLAYATLLTLVWLLKLRGEALIDWYQYRTETIGFADRLLIVLVSRWEWACSIVAAISLGTAFLVAGGKPLRIVVSLLLFAGVCSVTGLWIRSLERVRALSLIAHRLSEDELPFSVRLADLLVKTWAAWTPVVLLLTLVLVARPTPRAAP